ncbi:hypothetical protein EVS84_13400 [Pseudomonas koreensis]|uniref:DUF1534 domain-containing protein n=1 Tax=Pseudomonas koreensis TaxID=198620 RepID=A0A4Q4L6G8_9PSED|nr:hypothetical protein EVS84_13400 [Pseudomonas koreensis]
MAIADRRTHDRSRALRGNASRDAPRSSSGRDAERPGLHSHAEHGNDQTAFASRLAPTKAVKPDLSGSYCSLPSPPACGILRTHFLTRPRLAART